MKKKEKMTQILMKRTVDGILDVVFRMFTAQDEEKDFRTFCESLVNDTPSGFYARPISKKGGKEDVHD